MAFFTTTINFTDGQQVTSLNLNEIVIGLRLGADSVDGSTIILDSNQARVGVLTSANYGALSVNTGAIADLAITAGKLAADAVETAKIKDAAVTAAKIAADSVGYAKTIPADRATQADIQSATASHFVAPDVLKYSPGDAKAYGRVAFSNGSAAITGGFNVTGATDTGSGRQITLTQAMASTAYVVVANSSSGNAPINYTINSASTFTLDGPSEETGRSINFVVYGTLATPP